MEVHRAVTTFRRGCRAPLNIHTPQIDGGPIYGSDEAYVQSTLREPDTCFLRTSAGNLLPLSTSADAEGRFFFLAGDVRVSEHAFLTAQHHVRLSPQLKRISLKSVWGFYNYLRLPSSRSSNCGNLTSDEPAS